MANVLKITKPDKTIHVVPVANKSFYQTYNRRLPPSKRWKIDEIDESEAKDLPFIDETAVSPLEAVKKVDELTAENERLKKLLAEKNTGSSQSIDVTGSDGAGPQLTTLTAKEVIEKVKNASTVDEVNAHIAGDERKSVQDAAAKKIASLK